MSDYAFLILSRGVVIDHAPSIRKARKARDVAEYGGIENLSIVRTFLSAHAFGTVAYFRDAMDAEWYGVDDSQTYAFKAV